MFVIVYAWGCRNQGEFEVIYLTLLYDHLGDYVQDETSFQTCKM